MGFDDGCRRASHAPGWLYLPYFPSLIPALLRLAGPIELIRFATPPGEMNPSNLEPELRPVDGRFEFERI